MFGDVSLKPFSGHVAHGGREYARIITQNIHTPYTKGGRGIRSTVLYLVGDIVKLFVYSESTFTAVSVIFYLLIDNLL